MSHISHDIAFAVNVVSQHIHTPKEVHMEAVYKTFKYLKGSPGKGLFFKSSEINDIEVFTDVDWADLVEDRRYNTRYCTFIFKNLVTWRRVEM